MDHFLLPGRTCENLNFVFPHKQLSHQNRKASAHATSPKVFEGVLDFSQLIQMGRKIQIVKGLPESEK